MNSNVRTYKALDSDGLRDIEHKMEQQLAEIRARAYALFEQRGCVHGYDQEDWAAAEQELLGTPAIEMTETDDTVQIRMTVPGFTADRLEVTALAEAVMVEGDTMMEESRSGQGDKKANGKVRPPLVRHLFRHVALPHAINPEAVTARMEQETNLGPVLVIAARLQSTAVM